MLRNISTALKPVALKDISDVLAIELVSHACPWSETSFLSSLLAKHWFYGVFNQNQLLAYALIMPGPDDWELLNITTHPQHRGLGYCHTLLAAGATVAQSNHAQRLLLEVRQSNASALAAYRSFGFEQMAIRKNYYAVPSALQREDALMMHLELSKLSPSTLMRKV